MNKLSYREYLEEKKRRRKWPKINSGNEGSDDIDEPSDVREEWLIVDKHKNAIISKHGDDQKGATIAARKMDFAEWNKTHKLGRFCPMASHGPGAMAPDVANLEPGGKPKPKKKPATKAKTPAKKPASKAAPAKKATPAKAKVKTPGQGGGLGTQIGSLIAKHMAKMFKEEHELNELSPGTLGNYINKAHNRSKFLSMVSNQNHGQASTAASSIDREYQRKINTSDIGIRRATDRLTGNFHPNSKPKGKTNFLGKRLGKPSNQGGPSKTIAPNPNPSNDKDINPTPTKGAYQQDEPAPSNTHPNNVPTIGSSEWNRRKRIDRARNYLAVRHARTVGKSIDPSKYSYKSQNVLAGRSSSSNAGKVDYVKAARELAAKQRYAKLQGAEPSFSHRHPIITAVGKYLGKKALGAAGHALFASVNHEIEHLLFEMEETPNYYVQVLMSKGGVGDKSFRRHTIATMAPRHSGAPNEVFPEGFIPNLLLNDPKFLELKEEGYNTLESIYGSHDSNQVNSFMDEKHAHLVRVNDAIRRKFLPREEY